MGFYRWREQHWRHILNCFSTLPTLVPHRPPAFFIFWSVVFHHPFWWQLFDLICRGNRTNFDAIKCIRYYHIMDGCSHSTKRRSNSFLTRSHNAAQAHTLHSCMHGSQPESTVNVFRTHRCYSDMVFSTQCQGLWLCFCSIFLGYRLFLCNFLHTEDIVKLPQYKNTILPQIDLWILHIAKGKAFVLETIENAKRKTHVSTVCLL